MNWRNRHEVCAEYRRLDKKFNTVVDSPLHHDRRCPIHTEPAGENPPTVIALILAPPAARNHEPMCEATCRDPEGGGDVRCTIKPHGRDQLHVSHGVTHAVTWA